MLIAIGGLLNVGERMAFGCVKDYLNFFGLFLFNLNDILVTLGLGGFLVQWGNGNTKNS